MELIYETFIDLDRKTLILSLPYYKMLLNYKGANYKFLFDELKYYLKTYPSHLNELNGFQSLIMKLIRDEIDGIFFLSNFNLNCLKDIINLYLKMDGYNLLVNTKNKIIQYALKRHDLYEYLNENPFFKLLFTDFKSISIFYNNNLHKFVYYQNRKSNNYIFSIGGIINMDKLYIPVNKKILIEINNDTFFDDDLLEYLHDKPSIKFQQEIFLREINL